MVQSLPSFAGKPLTCTFCSCSLSFHTTLSLPAPCFLVASSNCIFDLCTSTADAQISFFFNSTTSHIAIMKLSIFAAVASIVSLVSAQAGAAEPPKWYKTHIHTSNNQLTTSSGTTIMISAISSSGCGITGTSPPLPPSSQQN